MRGKIDFFAFSSARVHNKSFACFVKITDKKKAADNELYGTIKTIEKLHQTSLQITWKYIFEQILYIIKSEILQLRFAGRLQLMRI